MADKLAIEPGQPGSVHFGPESRGFDEEFFLQLLSEHKEVKLSRGVRTTVWKRIRDRNEGLDLVVMVLCLLDVFRSQIDRMAEPQIIQENLEKPTAQPEPVRPTWGVIHRASLPSDTDGWQKGVITRPEDKPRSPCGVQNRPIEW